MARFYQLGKSVWVPRFEEKIRNEQHLLLLSDICRTAQHCHTKVGGGEKERGNSSRDRVAPRCVWCCYFQEVRPDGFSPGRWHNIVWMSEVLAAVVGSRGGVQCPLRELGGLWAAVKGGPIQLLKLQPTQGTTAVVG